MNQNNQKMVGVLVTAFTEETSGERALNALKEAKSLNFVHYEEIVLIRQEADGSVHYHETGDVTVGQKSGVGFLLGGLVRILGGPASVFGVVGASHHPQFSRKSLETLSVALKPATSAIALIRSAAFLQSVRNQVTGIEIREIVVELSNQLTAKLHAGKNVALGINLTEDGLEVVEVADSDTYEELIRIISAKDGVLRQRAAFEDSEEFIVSENPIDLGIIPIHDPSNPGA